MKIFYPKVSIVIPVYNGSNYLSEAIDSALAQTYKNIEIIVVNDGSNDKGATEKIAKSYGDKIRYFKKENGGVADALNFGIEKMTGEYFSWLSHDDMYYPNKIKGQIDFLKKQKNIAIILFTDYEYIDEEGKSIETINIKNRAFILDGRYIFLRKLINGLTLLVPKSAFDKVGPFNINKKYTQDYDMWYRLLKNNRFRYIETISAKTRIHKSQDSNTNRSQIEADEFWLSIIKNYEDEIFKDLFPNKIDFLVEAYNSLIYSNHQKTKDYLRGLLSETKNMNNITEILVNTKKELKNKISVKWKYLAIGLFVISNLLFIVLLLSLIIL